LFVKNPEITKEIELLKVYIVAEFFALSA